MKSKKYPNIAQSSKITGIVILGMQLLSPASLVSSKMIKKISSLAMFFLLTSAIAQEAIVKPNYLQYSMDSLTQLNFNKRLDSFFLELNQGNINPDFLTPKRRDLTISILQELTKYELKKDSINSKIKDKQLINIYPISKNHYSLSIAYTTINDNSLPTIMYIVNLIADTNNGKITFSIPIDYMTKNWKTEKVGNITYHFRDEIKKERAQIFNRKNEKIAANLGLEPEKFDFYMCDNYQEILKLLGLEYSITVNGQYRDGYGVDANTIFSIMNNEDFSHDVFHYYSGKVNDINKRNWITEEGIACSWGNAYYTDRHGEMIELKQLVDELKKYLEDSKNTNPLDLFENDPKIFNHIAPELSIRSVISGIICNEIELQKGIDGITKIINSGRTPNSIDAYFYTLNELIDMNKENFNYKIKELLKKY